ncbi:hypothetical protein M9458_000408, partial [Cirrhinus mrigala]
SDSLLDLLNLVCVIVGLVFFSLALLSFTLCQWSPGVNNSSVGSPSVPAHTAVPERHTASAGENDEGALQLSTASLRIIITVSHGLQVLCAVISGLLHFLFLSGFVWMFIEAVLLFICVKNLSQISSRNRTVLSSGFLCVIGYVVAQVVVGLSVGL